MIQIELPLLLAIVGALGFCLGLIADPALKALLSPSKTLTYEPPIYPAPTPFTQTEITYTSESPKPKQKKKGKR